MQSFTSEFTSFTSFSLKFSLYPSCASATCTSSTWKAAHRELSESSFSLSPSAGGTWNFSSSA